MMNDYEFARITFFLRVHVSVSSTVVLKLAPGLSSRTKITRFQSWLSGCGPLWVVAPSKLADRQQTATTHASTAAYSLDKYKGFLI